MSRCKEIIQGFLTSYNACKNSPDLRLQELMKALEENKAFSKLLSVLQEGDWSIFEEKAALIEGIQKAIDQRDRKFGDLLTNQQIAISDENNTLMLTVGSVWQSAETLANGYLCKACGSNPCRCLPVEEGPYPDDLDRVEAQ